MKIPEQLKNCRFIKTDNDKRPIEKKWNTENNYSYEEFKTDKTTYGVVCGINKLVVIDCDQRYVQDRLLAIQEIRETFIVKTATKKLYHFYFFVDIENPPGFRIDNRKGERILDLQGEGTQVIGPNSEILSKGCYEIVNPRKISIIPYDYLKEILINIDPEVKILQEAKKENTIDIEFDEVCKVIKENIKPKDLLPKRYQDINPTKCPLGHTSEGGKSFHHTNDVWHCFHCNQSGNVFKLYQKLHKCNFQTAKKELAKKIGIEDDLKVKFLQLYADTKTRMDASELLVREIKKFNKIYSLITPGIMETEMWIYKDGIFVPGAQYYIKEYIRDIMGGLYAVNFAKIILDKIICDTLITPKEFFKNEDINKIPVLNGIVDIKENKLEDYSNKYRFFIKLPLVYDPLIKPVEIIKFFKEVLEKEEDLKVIQELFGYILYRNYRFEKAWMFLGKGRNGKSKTLELMQKFLGIDNCINISLQDLNNQFLISRFHNKLANLAGDLPKQGLTETNRFKALTGNDTITGDRKFQSPIEFKNYAKLIFAANQLPESFDSSDGFYDRWIVLNFPYKFVDYPKEKNEKLIDTTIINKISTDKELSGLLNWAIEGLHRLLKNGKFSHNKSTEETKTSWIKEESSVTAFLMDCIDLDHTKGTFITMNDFNREYGLYCAKNKIRPESNVKVNRKIREFGGDASAIKRINMNLIRVHNWLKFKPHLNIKTEIDDLDNEAKILDDF